MASTDFPGINRDTEGVFRTDIQVERTDRREALAIERRYKRISKIALCQLGLRTGLEVYVRSS